MELKKWENASREKILDPNDLFARCRQWKKEKKKLVTVNGSFDIMHAGHLQLLYEASQLGDLLIVGLNTDASIIRYKSKNRPIISLGYRLQMIAALSFVDYVSNFEEDNPIAFLSEIKPDVHVNGSEYGYDCIEAQTVKDNGGKLHIADLLLPISTTKIIQKITTCD